MERSSGTWAKRTAAQAIAAGYCLDIDVGYKTITALEYTSGAPTMSKAVSYLDEVEVGDQVVSAHFPSNTLVTDISVVSGTATITCSQNATSSSTGSVSFFAPLPTTDGCYVVNDTRDNYTGSFTPTLCPQFTPSLNLINGDVIQRSSGVWSKITMPTLFDISSCSINFSFTGGKVDGLTQYLFNHANTGYQGKVTLNTEFKNINRVYAKRPGDFSSNSINPGYGGEVYNPAFTNDWKISGRFTNVGQCIIWDANTIQNLVVHDDVVIEDSTSMIAGIVCINAVNAKFD
jgi:hypothetical protein